MLLLPVGFASDEPAVMPSSATRAMTRPPSVNRREGLRAVGPVPSFSLIPDSPRFEVADGSAPGWAQSPQRFIGGGTRRDDWQEG